MGMCHFCGMAHINCVAKNRRQHYQELGSETISFHVYTVAKVSIQHLAQLYMYGT